jgi:hypothetical protein
MEKAARRISEEMDLLELHQQYMRQREIRHRQSMFLSTTARQQHNTDPLIARCNTTLWHSTRTAQESTNSRVFWMSIFESLFLISISVGQVYLIRSFFANKGRSGV